MKIINHFNAQVNKLKIIAEKDFNKLLKSMKILFTTKVSAKE